MGSQKYQYNGIFDLRETLSELGFDLNKVISSTALLVHPETYNYHRNLYGDGIYYRGFRRGRNNEIRGTKTEEGETIDDNTYANGAIKKALGLDRKIRDYTVCHIYRGSCYSSRYHTELANLVLLPSPLSSLTDFFDDSIMTLKYRVYELYGFFIDSPPTRPVGFPSNWRKMIELNQKITHSIKNKRIGKLQDRDGVK